MTTPNKEKQRASWLTMPQQYRLNIVGTELRKAGLQTYHVGSSLTKRDYHDVDLRCILADNKFDALTGVVAARLELLNAVFSEWASSLSGLPVDFQFQRMSEANMEFPTEIRSAIGL